MGPIKSQGDHAQLTWYTNYVVCGPTSTSRENRCAAHRVRYTVVLFTPSSLVTLLHPQAQSSLKITNRSFRYAAPHLWNKLPPSLRVPCQSAISECSRPFPGSDSAPKSVVGVSHGVFHSRLKTHLFPHPFPRNLPLSLTDWVHGFYPTRVQKSLALKTLISAAD